jgi:hypothetical protein
MSRLRRLRDQFKAGVAAGEVDSETATAVLGQLDNDVEVAEARGAAARAVRLADLEAMRAGVVAAIRALAPLPNCPIGRRTSIVLRRIRVRGPAAFGLPREPGRRLVRAMLIQADVLVSKRSPDCVTLQST